MATPLRTRAFVVLAASGMAAALLGLVFWSARTPPDIGCLGPSTTAEYAAVDAFRAWSYPMHALVSGVLLTAILWLGAGGWKGITAAIGYVVLLGAGQINHDIYAIPGIVGYFGFIFVVPVATIAAVLSAAMLARGRERPGVRWAQAAGWIGLVLMLPAHFAAVWFVDEPLCL